MKRTSITLTVLLLLVAACWTEPASTPVPSPTATAWLPPPAVTPSPMATVTPTPVPTWPILFHGAPCEETESECAVSEDTPIAYYSIESDGSGLEQVTEFPSGLLPPEGSPRPYGEPRFSPDGRLLAYAASEGLYVVDTVDGAGWYIFRPEDVPGVNPVGPVCWTPDGETIEFVARHWIDGRWHNAFYSTGLDGASPRLLFTLDDLDSFIWTGACSPDGREMAFAINPYGQKETGIYLVDLESGEWQRILTQYMVDLIRAPMSLTLRAQTEALRESGKIIFAGVPCRLRGPDCTPLPSDPLYYYAINRDGSGLENVLAIPSLIVPPAGAPAEAFDGPVQPSPDGSMVAYAELDGIYVVDMASGETRRVPPEDYTPPGPLGSYRRAPVCWSADQVSLNFKEQWRWKAFSTVPLDAETTQEVLPVFQNSGTIVAWDCSRGGQELAFSLSPQGGEKRGLQVLDLESGEQLFIVDDYEVVSVGVWPSRSPYTFAPILGQIWQVFFKGAPCAELLAGCTGDFEHFPEHYYSIYSDGTGLQEIMEIPQLSYNPRLSPDGSLSIQVQPYDTVERSQGLYVTGSDDSEARRLIGPQDIPDVVSAHRLVPTCWSPDDSTIRFYVRIQESEGWKGAFYTIDSSGENLQRLFASVSLEGWWATAAGICSPNYREAFFPISASDFTPLREVGLYSLNLDCKVWRPILLGYDVYKGPVIESTSIH